MLAKKRSRRRKLGIKLLIYAGLILFLGALVYLFFFSPVFKIKNIEVVGRELAPDLEYGSPGDNILLWDIEESELPPLVENVTYDKSYVNRSVTVELTEREKYLIWCYNADGSCYWVDRTGYLFSGAPDFRGSLNFKLVRDMESEVPELGSYVLEQPMFENIIAAFDFMERLDIQVNEVLIESLSRREFVAKVAGGKDIFFSMTHDPDFGESVVKSLRESGEWSLIRYLDLRVPGRAYYSQ